MVDYSSLENYRTERYRGFESLSLRKRVPRTNRGTLFNGRLVLTIVFYLPLSSSNSFYLQGKQSLRKLSKE